MLPLLDELTLQAQSVLDDLWTKKLIPFQLRAHRVESLRPEVYAIRFHDSRLHSVDVSWKKEESFKDKVRVAVLAKVGRLTGPFKYTPN